MITNHNLNRREGSRVRQKNRKQTSTLLIQGRSSSQKKRTTLSSMVSDYPSEVSSLICSCAEQFSQEGLQTSSDQCQAELHQQSRSEQAQSEHQDICAGKTF
jgi:hypothetical protein